MKKLLLGICYNLITQVVFSQSISGRVIDAQNNAPIPSVTVELDNQSAALTNEKGEFLISKLKPGTYHLLISSIGYKTQEIQASPSTEPILIKMETWNLFMQPVEVKAIRASDQAPFTKTNLSKKEIEKILKRILLLRLLI